MKNLAFHWRPAITPDHLGLLAGEQPQPSAWIIDCPEAPTPAQLAWLKAWALTGDRLQHLLSTSADQACRAQALEDLLHGRIVPNVLGARMNGMGDLILHRGKAPHRPTVTVSGMATPVRSHQRVHAPLPPAESTLPLPAPSAVSDQVGVAAPPQGEAARRPPTSGGNTTALCDSHGRAPAPTIAESTAAATIFGA